MDFQQRIKQMNDENNASHKAIMDKFKSDAKAWGSNLKNNFELEVLQNELDSINKIYGSHDNDIRVMNEASQQRIDKYREQGQQRIEQARDELPDEEPGNAEPENDDISNELLNRMNDNE